MNMMNDVLSDSLDDFVLLFLDDILVYSRIVEIHTEHLGKVLETEVASWTTAYNEQMMSQSNPIGSGSGVSSNTQMMPQVSMTVPISFVMTIPLSPPQGPLPNIGEVQVDNRFPLGPKGNRHVSFGLVFDASSRQDGNNGAGGGNTGNDGTLQTKPMQMQQGGVNFQYGN